MGELAPAVLPASERAAFDALEELVRTANKAPITSESANPDFSAEVFARLAAEDAGRVRAAASRLEDRLRRITALAAFYRSEARALEERPEALKGSLRTDKAALTAAPDGHRLLQFRQEYPRNSRSIGRTLTSAPPVVTLSLEFESEWRAESPESPHREPQPDSARGTSEQSHRR